MAPNHGRSTAAARGPTGAFVKLVVIASDSFAGSSMLRQQVDGTLAISEDPAALRAEITDAEVVAVAPRHGRLLREIWPAAKQLRWVHALGAGVEPLLFDELLSSDVVLTNARGVFADALAEFAIAAMLWFAKDLRRLADNQRQQRWEPYTVDRLEGQTAGIIGYGGIGGAVGRRAAALGMHVLAMRKRTTLANCGDVTRWYASDELDELIAGSDFLVLATPLTPATARLMSRARLSHLKPTAVLINVSRGAVIDEDALVEMLSRRLIRGAALDVFENEPLPPGHLLWSLDNVLISPHTADHTSDSHLRSTVLFIENLRRFERGEPLRNVVDKREHY